MTSTILILTVGTGTAGSHSNLSQGLANTIRLNPPTGFYLIPSTSEDSAAVAELILEALGPELRDRFIPWSESAPFLRIPEPDNLECSRTIIRTVIRRAKTIDPDGEIIVNPTSGTKQMSSAATLAALDEGVGSIVFTTGQRRDGVVMTGTETVTPFDPARWRAEKDAQLAAELWDREQHQAAAEVMRSAARRLNAGDALRDRLLGIALAADAFAHQQSFQFQAAVGKFKDARRQLKVDESPAGSPVHRFGRQCDDTRKRMDKLVTAQGGKRDTVLQRLLLAEILDNASRCAKAGRFEDAACRLYRAIEMELQIRLSEKTGNAYWNGRLTGKATAPEILCSSGFLTTIRRTEPPREFSMEQLARALQALADDSVAGLCEDLDRDQESRFRKASENRNTSILAHGVSPVDAQGFKNLKSAAHDFLGLSTSILHPRPAFDLRWLEVGDSRAEPAP